MTAVLLAALLLPWDEPTPVEHLDGMATYYNAGIMERVAANRGMELDGVVGFVALNRAGDLGRLVWLERNGVVYGPFRVVDCAQDGSHYRARERRGLVVEVGWDQAMAWEMHGPIPVRVWFSNPIPEPPNAF